MIVDRSGIRVEEAADLKKEPNIQFRDTRRQKKSKMEDWRGQNEGKHMTHKNIRQTLCEAEVGGGITREKMPEDFPELMIEMNLQR